MVQNPLSTFITYTKKGKKKLHIACEVGIAYFIGVGSTVSNCLDMTIRSFHLNTI